MKKFIVIALIIAAILIPLTAFAATNDVVPTQTPAQGAKVEKARPPQIDPSKLTDAQKKDLEDQHLKMIALQKETIAKMVANSTITKEQGDEMISRMDQMEKTRIEKGIVPMPFMGKGQMGKGNRPPMMGKEGRQGCPKGNCTPPAPQEPNA